MFPITKVRLVLIILMVVSTVTLKYCNGSPSPGDFDWEYHGGRGDEGTGRGYE